jgi:hypothetical protein
MSVDKIMQRLGAAPREDFPVSRDWTEAIKICQTLLTKLQDPFKRVWEAVVDFLALAAGIKLCLDTNLFFKWKESGNGDQNRHDLAKTVALDRVDILGTSLSASESNHFTHPSIDCSGRIMKHIPSSKKSVSRPTGRLVSPMRYLPLQRLVSNTCESASLDQPCKTPFE